MFVAKFIAFGTAVLGGHFLPLSVTHTHTHLFSSAGIRFSALCINEGAFGGTGTEEAFPLE